MLAGECIHLKGPMIHATAPLASKPGDRPLARETRILKQKRITPAKRFSDANPRVAFERQRSAAHENHNASSVKAFREVHGSGGPV